MEDATRILANTGKPVPRSDGRAYLVYIYPTGPNMGTRYLLESNEIIIGRDEKCHVCNKDESVSRRHARIYRQNNEFYVEDLNSTNGTYLNEKRLEGKQKLEDGAYLHIGSAIYRFLASSNLEAAYHEEIYRLTIIDALTGVHNKRYFNEFLTRELSCAVRYRRPLSLAMLDIDHFKTVNDKFGHLYGDYALRELATCVRGIIRKEDLLARYGGEEFGLVMPETPCDGAIQIAERIRHTIANHDFLYEGRKFHISISIGIASTAGDEWLTTAELVQQADTKLYQAKREGRNRVVF